MLEANIQLSISNLLREQQDIQLESAVTQFAKRSEMGTGKYQSIIPLEAPKAGQQYRFEVDLDECTGCKSCVSACHSLNGLDSGEMWRKVGSLEQTFPGLASLSQTITSACHHCLEPACALGCPVKAYEKDPVTGIVRHLDDQCIGCQYCVMMCPYDVPVYNSRLGIVRKCDMCSSRIGQGEAPACAQACPTDAIKIGIVDQDQLQNQNFLPSAADPHITQPSTLYKRKEQLPGGVRSADHFQLQSGASHRPLVWMLLLSQAGVGMLLWELLAVLLPIHLSNFNTLFAVGLVALALALATLHLGRPHKAWRFFLGLRTSWMSREILAFNFFMFFAGVEFFVNRLNFVGWTSGKSALLVTGLSGVYCSTMIYVQTRRPTWTGFRCVLRFCGSTLILGLFGVYLAELVFHDNALHLSVGSFWIGLTLVLLLGKCLLEAREIIPYRQSASQTFRSLLAQWKILGYWTWTRWLSAWVSASALILALVGPSHVPWILLAAAACVIGEYCERSIFFRGALLQGMPGL